MAVSDVVVSAVEQRSDLNEFIQLPKRLYAGNRGYVPPLDLEQREALSADKNPIFGHVEARFFLARRGGRVVGRISAQVNRAHLEYHPDATGHFGFLAAEDDPAVFAALFSAAETWLRGFALTRAVGPLSLTMHEEVGVLVEGFDRPPMLMLPWDPPYAGARIEACGYGKLKDLTSYAYDVETAPPIDGQRLLKHAGVTERVKVRAANMKMFPAEFRTLASIYNDAWADSLGFVPWGEAEIDHLAKVLRPLIQPEFLVFVEVDDEAVAFILALTNLSEATVDLGGKLNFWTLTKLLYRLKIGGVASLRVPLIGVRRHYHAHPLLGGGLAMMAIERLRDTGRRLGKRTAELGWVAEDNKAAHRLIRKLGGTPSRTHRLYAKALAQ
jgi:hypothetical protein